MSEHRAVAWGGAAVVGAVAGHWLSPTVASAVRSADGAGPVDPGPAAVVLLATGWLAGWGVLTLVEVARCLTSPARTVAPRSRVARLLVEALVGSTLVSATGAVAEAPPDPPALPAGLEVPDRVTGEPSDRKAPPGPARVVVTSGDTLWAIAEGLLDRTRSAAVDRAWRRLYLANRHAVGPDPDLIHPGTLLRVPGSLTAPRTGACR